MSAAPSPPPVAPSSPASPPWWVHFLTGWLLLGSGLLLLIARPGFESEAYFLLGSGGSFLGVGVGVASQAISATG